MVSPTPPFFHLHRPASRVRSNTNLPPPSSSNQERYQQLANALYTPSIEFLGSVPSCSSNLVVEIPLLLFPMQIPPSGVRSPQLVMSSVTSQVVAVKAENALLLSQVTRVSRQYSTSYYGSQSCVEGSGKEARSQPSSTGHSTGGAQ